MDSFLVSRRNRQHNRRFGDTIFKILCIFYLKMTNLSPPILLQTPLETRFLCPNLGSKDVLKKRRQGFLDKVETVLSFGDRIYEGF